MACYHKRENPIANAKCGEQAFANLVGPQSCSCDEDNDPCGRLVNNHIINGGRNRDGSVVADVNRSGRCREAQADTAFIWFAFACFLGSFALSFMAWRKGGRK